MKRFSTLLSLSLALAVLAAAAVARGEEREDDEGEEEGEVQVKLSDCPKAVQKTIKKEAGDGRIREIEKETENGKTVYEAEFVVKGKTYEITVAEDGKLLDTEREDGEEDDDDDGDDDDDEGAGEDDDDDDDK